MMGLIQSQTAQPTPQGLASPRSAQFGARGSRISNRSCHFPSPDPSPVVLPLAEPVCPASPGGQRDTPDRRRKTNKFGRSFFFIGRQVGEALGLPRLMGYREVRAYPLLPPPQGRGCGLSRNEALCPLWGGIWGPPSSPHLHLFNFGQECIG